MTYTAQKWQQQQQPHLQPHNDFKIQVVAGLIQTQQVGCANSHNALHYYTLYLFSGIKELPSHGKQQHS